MSIRWDLKWKWEGYSNKYRSVSGIHFQAVSGNTFALFISLEPQMDLLFVFISNNDILICLFIKQNKQLWCKKQILLLKYLHKKNTLLWFWIRLFAFPNLVKAPLPWLSECREWGGWCSCPQRKRQFRAVLTSNNDKMLTPLFLPPPKQSEPVCLQGLACLQNLASLASLGLWLALCPPGQILWHNSLPWDRTTERQTPA